MVAARDWLVEQGIARSDAIFLHGWSYGGFLTLWGLARRPDLWAGGLAMVAIADWSVNFQDASDALKAAFTAWFAGTPKDKPELFMDRSPATHAENIQAPLLVIQGHNDTRTTARQMELFEARMRSMGKDIQVEWFDAGHGVGKVDQLIGFQETQLRFAYAVLEKRASESRG
jgi:dipeptidyl aminopeptidase/acylaminoacyl peptidase